jgi:hypothetical protein
MQGRCAMKLIVTPAFLSEHPDLGSSTISLMSSMISQVSRLQSELYTVAHLAKQEQRDELLRACEHLLNELPQPLVINLLAKTVSDEIKQEVSQDIVDQDIWP